MSWGDPDALMAAVGRFVREVGFPVAVAVFVLWRLDDRVQALVQAADETTAVLREMRDRQCGRGLDVAPAKPRRGVLEMSGAGGDEVVPGGRSAAVPGGFRALSLRAPVLFQ